MGWEELASDQEGVVARRQLLDLGRTASAITWSVESGRWGTVFPGVYVTHRGPVTDLARTWAAVLWAGPGACASHGTALWLTGAREQPPPTVQVIVPEARRPRPLPGVRVHRRIHAERLLQPASNPPRTRIEEAVLDVAEASADAEQVVGAVLGVTQRRLTTAQRLRVALADRKKHRWRALVEEVLAEVDDGVASPLELRYARRVERAHRLPAGVRNRAERGTAPTARYHDVRYDWGLVIELDGRAAHPGDGAFRDHRRDNSAVRRGDRVLRYGWRDVAGRPCAVAAEVASVLTAGGWPGRPHPCGPTCLVPPVITPR